MRLHILITYGAKLLNADWLRQRAIFRNHEGTFGNQNTKKSTDYWTSIFQLGAKTRGKTEQLESYEVPELNKALDNFALYVINK